MSVTTLYRFYNTDDELLYVGISEHGPARWKAHRKDKPWWTDVARTTTEHHDTRQAALDAERAAIKAEKPRHNVVHNRGDVGPDPDGEWRFTDPSGREHTSDLTLHWELALDGIDFADDAYIAPIQHLLQWASEVHRHGPWHNYPPMWAPINWYIAAPAAGAFESSPGAPNHPAGESHFLNHYSTPVHTRNRWLFCPQARPDSDKSWTHDHRTPGGYIQAATGWKPLPHQPAMDAMSLLIAADAV